MALRAGLFCVETVLEKTNFFGEANVVQKQLELPHTGSTMTDTDETKIRSGAIPMAMSASTPATTPTAHYSTGNYPPRNRNRSTRGLDTTTTTMTSWPKRDHRIIRHYLGNAAYPQRVIEDLLTEGEVREHCISAEACSMTCTSKAGKRRTRRLGHWFDTFEKYR